VRQWTTENGVQHRPPDGDTDEALCERVARRDEAAFDLLVTRYQGPAYRLAWSLLRDAEEARDLSQEAFVRLYEMAARFRGESRFSTWFYRILVNLCLDHRRRGRGWRQLLFGGDQNGTAPIERHPAPFTDPADTLEQEHVKRRLWAAVDRLPARQRAAVLLQAQQELSTAEVAAVLGCSEATVRVHVHRAVAALRMSIGGDER
jgi:RNA polymerase sigma-70 factor, ECF subfamily